MIKINLRFGGIAVFAWISINAWAVILPFNGDAFETASRGRLPSQYQDEGGNVLVFDNDLLARLFGKDRALERSRDNTEPPSRDVFPQKVFTDTHLPPVLPNRSLLAAISPNTNSRRAAALRLAERGRTLMKDREFQKAISFLEKALSLDGSPFIYYYLASAHYHLGNGQGSLNFLEVAESRLFGQPEWMGEIAALRLAASRSQAVQQPVPTQNVGWFVADY